MRLLRYPRLIARRRPSPLAVPVAAAFRITLGSSRLRRRACRRRTSLPPATPTAIYPVVRPLRSPSGRHTAPRSPLRLWPMHSEPVKQALAYERYTHLPAILQTGDRMTMGAAIEARLPFTDPKLLEFAALASVSDLFSGPHGKQPLRAAMAGKLPQAVIERRKRGWTSPYWIYLRDAAAASIVAREDARARDHRPLSPWPRRHSRDRRRLPQRQPRRRARRVDARAASCCGTRSALRGSAIP